jgi:O-antigen/teichoic acid export membrane protein
LRTLRGRTWVRRIARTEAGRGLGFASLRLGQHGLLFAAALLATRQLGPEGRAQYALPFALGLFIFLLFHLSLDASTGRLRGRGEASLQELASLRSLTSAVLGSAGFVAALVAGLLLRNDLLMGASYSLVLTAAAAVPAYVVAQAAMSLLVLMDELMTYGLLACTTAAAQLAAIVVLTITDGVTPLSALLVLVSGQALTAVTCWIAVGRHLGKGSLRPSASRSLLLRAVRIGSVLHPSAIAVALSLQIDVMILGAVAPREEVGYYSVAVTIAQSAFLAVGGMTQTSIPRQLSGSDVSASRYTAVVVRQYFLVGAGLAAVAIPLTYPLVVLVLGEQFRGAVLPCMVLLVAMLALTIQGPVRVLLLRVIDPWKLSVAGIGALLVNGGLTVALASQLGAEGAAIASVATYWLYTAVIWWLFRQWERTRSQSGTGVEGEIMSEPAAAGAASTEV